MARLNERVLPEGYYAETQIHIGGRVEVDVATLEEAQAGAAPRNGPALALATQSWAPPAPPLVQPTIFPDEIEVQIISTAEGTGAYLSLNIAREVLEISSLRIRRWCHRNRKPGK
jgi:hypothetical protein